MKPLTYLVFAAAIVTACGPPTVTVTELATSMPDNNNSGALGVSDNGRIVGFANGGSDAAEFMEDGDVILLPPPSLFRSCRAVGITDDGLIAGTCSTFDDNEFNSSSQAVFWDAERTLHEFIPAELNVSSGAVDVNRSGVILGYSNVSNVNGELTHTPWIYDARSGTRTNLPVTQAGLTITRASAAAINDLGDIVGSGSDELFSPDRALKWSANSLTLTVLPTPAGCDSLALGINDHGVIVGRVCHTEPLSGRAALWSSATASPELLPELPKDEAYPERAAQASGINNHGMVIGESSARIHRLLVSQTGVVWMRDRTPIDLGVDYPTAINASGVIVGSRDGKAVRVTVQ
jgi:uncharacterized membrane protein